MVGAYIAWISLAGKHMSIVAHSCAYRRLARRLARLTVDERNGTIVVNTRNVRSFSIAPPILTSFAPGQYGTLVLDDQEVAVTHEVTHDLFFVKHGRKWEVTRTSYIFPCYCISCSSSARLNQVAIIIHSTDRPNLTDSQFSGSSHFGDTTLV